MALEEIQVTVSLHGEDLEEFLLLERFLREMTLSEAIDRPEVLREAMRHFYERLLLHTFLEVVFEKARETQLVDSVKLRELMSRKSLEDPAARKIVNELLNSEEKRQIIHALAKAKKLHGIPATIPFQQVKTILEEVNHL
ncbi:MAG: hypothetical protein ACFFGZ_07925 [Candidatus Thorarchaeota archaeon]